MYRFLALVAFFISLVSPVLVKADELPSNNFSGMSIAFDSGAGTANGKSGLSGRLKASLHNEGALYSLRYSFFTTRGLFWNLFSDDSSPQDFESDSYSFMYGRELYNRNLYALIGLGYTKLQYINSEEKIYSGKMLPLELGLKLFKVLAVDIELVYSAEFHEDFTNKAIMFGFSLDF